MTSIMGPPVEPVRAGMAHWLQSYVMMTRWELSSLRLLLPLIVALQVVIGGGFALGIGLFFNEMPARNALFLATGVAVVTLITVGIVLSPQLVSNHKILLFSTIVVPIAQFPGWLASVHRVLPFYHIAQVIRDAPTNGLVTDVWLSYAVLAAWTVSGWVVTAWVVGRRG